MGQVTSWITDQSLPKEENPFYMETKNLMKNINYIVGPLEKRSDSELIIPITNEGNKYELQIKNFKFGIFRISFDFVDKSIKYKNKVDIGENLLPLKFDNIIEEKNKISITTKDDSKEKEINIYKLIIYISNFHIEYFINDNLLLSINKEKNLNIINNCDTQNNKFLKSNTMDICYYNMSQIYGLPERPSQLFLKDGDYRLFNLDACLDAGVTKPTYGCIPILHGVNNNQILTIFNNNSSDQYVEIKTGENKEKKILWLMEGGIIDLYIVSDTDFYRNHKKIAEITGYSIMPPLWSFGYHQCRWGYKDCNDVMEVEKKFNELNIPFDCFWFDIEHTDQKKYFTWDPNLFCNIKELLDKLNNEHRYFVTIIDPHIKKDDNYFICNKLKEKDIFVKKNTKNEKNEYESYEGSCWPGLSYYVDFLNYEKVLHIYKDLFKNTESYFYNLKNHGTWIDMNEPSVFTLVKSEERTMPKTNIHYDGNQYVEHREIHNIYGYFYQKVAYESLKYRMGENKRAFILTRSFYAGSQKYGFIWTGDQCSTFEYLNSSIETNMINSLCGISGTGSDVGGFMKNPTPELMKVWYNLGNFYPFFRGHSMIGTIRREPWLFEKEICDSIIESIRLRYHLLMYVYTKFYQHTKNGIPLLKPMWMKFRNNFDDFINTKEQGAIFVFGEELIGCNSYTITEREVDILLNRVKVPIYELTGEKFEKIKEKSVQTLCIGGNIIPWTENIEKCSYFVRSAPITLKVFVDENKNAIGHYYLDDGISIDTNGEYIYMEFVLKNKVLKIKNINKLENFEKKDICEIAPLYNRIEIYGYGKIISIKLEIKELKVIYEEKNDCNIIDLLNEKIKVYKCLEIELIQ